MSSPEVIHTEEAPPLPGATTVVTPAARPALPGAKLPWVALPEGVPCFDAYYDRRKLWPTASLERRRAILG